MIRLTPRNAHEKNLQQRRWSDLILTSLFLCAALALILIAYLKLSLKVKETINLGDIFFEGILFVLVLVWVLVILPYWKTFRLLSLGIVLFLFGNFSDLLDEFLELPKWVTGYFKDGLLVLGAGFSTVGLWLWIKERQGLIESLKDSSENQRFLRELSQDITSLDIHSLLEKLTERVREVFNVDISDVRLLEGSTAKVIGVAGAEFGASQRNLGIRGGRSKRILETGRPVSESDITKSTEYERELTRYPGIRGYLGVPLFSRRGEVMGILRALRYQPREFTQEEVDLLQQLANSAAVALENARLITKLESTNIELERSLREQRALREFLSNLLLLDLDKLLQRMTEQAALLFQAEFVWLRLLDEKNSIRTRAATGDEAVLKFINLGAEGKLVGRGKWMLDHRRPLAVRDMAQDPARPYHGAVKAADLHGFLGAPLFSRGQKPLGVIFVLTRSPREFSQRDLNLVEQFAAGAAIAIENARLFEEVQKKTKELEEALKTKSEFLNTMAHELKTPLGVLIATQQLFMEDFYGELHETHKQGFQIIERNLYHLLSLIDSILNLARFETKKVSLDIEEFNLYEMIEELESTFAPLVKEKGLEFKLDIENAVVKLKSDRSKIKVVLENLVGNAVKYTDRGKVDLRISTASDGGPGGSQSERLSITVCDTGTGIRESDLPHIFDAFYMGKGMNRRKYPGSGLGLSIVKKILQLLEGDIQVQSEWGKGSTFTATLPLVHPTERQDIGDGDQDRKAR